MILAGFEKERDRLEAMMNSRGAVARVSDAAGSPALPLPRQVSNH
jgi:hypothetical protein